MKHQMKQNLQSLNSKQVVNQQNHKIDEPYFTHMQECHIDQASSMLATSFIKLNPMWIKMGAKFDQVLSVIRGRMISCCRGQNSFVLIDPKTTRLLAVNYNIDLLNIFNTVPMPNNSQFFKKLGKYAGQLQNQYFEQLRKKAKKGQIIYTYGGALDQAYAQKGESKKFWSLTLLYLQQTDYKTYIGRCTNRIITKIFLQLGAKILKVVHIDQPGVTNQFLEMIQVDLNNLGFSSIAKYYPDKKYQDDEQDQQ